MKISLKALNSNLIERAVELGLTTAQEINKILASGVLTLEVEAGKIPADMMKKLIVLEAIIEETPKVEEAPKTEETPKKKESTKKKEAPKKEESPKKESPEKETPATEESPKVEEAPKVEETPKKEAPKKKEVKKPLTEGEILLDTSIDFMKSVALQGVILAEQETKKVANAFISGGANVIKGGAIQRISGKATLITGLISMGTDWLEDATGLNLDTLQAGNDLALNISSGVFGLSVFGNFVQGAMKGSDERTKEILESVMLSKEEGQKLVDKSIVLAPLDLKF